MSVKKSVTDSQKPLLKRVGQDTRQEFFLLKKVSRCSVIEGEFRQYKGPRDVDSMLGYVEQKRWKQTEPVPAWKAPDSLQMGLVAQFFKLSQALRVSVRQTRESFAVQSRITESHIRHVIF